MAKQGYWQSSNHSDYIFSCDKFAPYCTGGETYSKNPCLDGHMGPLCQSCDIRSIYHHQTFYHRAGESGCDICPATLTISLAIIGSMFLIQLVMISFNLISSLNFLMDAFGIEVHKKKKEKIEDVPKD